MEEIDIWRTARLLMKQRDDPEFFAAQRADELLAAGDPDGSRIWTRIVLAIRNLEGRKTAQDWAVAGSRPANDLTLIGLHGQVMSGMIPSDGHLEERAAFMPFLGREAVYWEGGHIIHIRIAQIEFGSIAGASRCMQLELKGLRTPICPNQHLTEKPSCEAGHKTAPDHYARSPNQSLQCGSHPHRSFAARGIRGSPK